MTSTPPASPSPSLSESTAGQAVSIQGDCAAQLSQRFPALFGGACKPLKLRIQADIQQRAPGAFGKHVLTAFLRRHTGSTAYLLAMSKATHRIDLDGQPSGAISDEHRQAAIDELRRRRDVRNERLEQAEVGRRNRAALLHDFERTTLTLANFCALKGIEPQALEALLMAARDEAAERAHGPPQVTRASPQRRPDGPRSPRR